MDADSNDGTVGESLNGETKPDVAKLAQSAIIKQDVMLSATTTQSPLASQSSVFTIPSVSMGTGGINLTDHLFLPGMSALDPSHNGEIKAEHNGSISSLASPSQLFGQPQVAPPQFFLTGNPLQSQTGASGGVPVQQLLIPVSTGNGTQQFISIPVSMATGGNQQIQLLTTSNGQIVATNLANLAGLSNPLGASLANSVNNLASQSLLQNTGSQHSTASQALTNHLAAVAPSLLAAGAQSHLLAGLGQQLLSHVSLAQSNASDSPTGQASSPSPAQTVLNSLQQTLSAGGGCVNGLTIQPTVSARSVSHNYNNSPTQIKTLNTNSAQTAHILGKISEIGASGHSSTAMNLANQILATRVTSTQLINHVPSSLEGLMPNTVGNSTESTTVDGINLDEIKEFAKQFKIRRLSLGLTQTQVGQALSATEGPAYSQSAICRFEKLDITPKSAQKIKPVLERWMAEAEERYKNGMQNLTEFIGSEPSKKRKRRTSFTPQALELLNKFFERNTHPSGAEMTELADKLNYDREVIRVWFCNKRQALKNTIKKLKQEGPGLCT
ncbi:POU domain, class 6, transcription factor 2-like [Mya arenaria]|uniref:POU domain, class 6, transcription factor 2-like n=1 Tax=Mya arenaria TaxID=6604 RepID=UPI0022E0F673|nr:POU domain, class 6, transcription factor 2-like [Mya arenaria]XP_052812183.1 POU domain, class 6, transcription factor 2-like [Mya arenaria]